jgi:GWxTD domain-containing protein
VAVIVAVVVLILGPAELSAGKKRPKAREDLINVLLSPGLAQWLIGPIARIATPEEVDAYLALTDDHAAGEFIDDFWSKRIDPSNPWPGRQLRDVFDRRAEEADRLFSEEAYVGRRTDRGVIHVIYGPPAKRTFVQEATRRKATVEIWVYGSEAAPGLDGSKPKTEYFFAKRGDVTEQTQRPKKLEALPRGRVP